MYCPAKNGRKDIIDFMLQCGVNDFHYAIKGSSEGGHLDLTLHILQHYKENNDSIYDWGLYGACKGGHLELIDFMLSRCKNIHLGLEGACQQKNIEITNMILQNMKPFKKYLNTALCASCLHGNIEAVNLFLSLGADDYNYSFVNACIGGHNEIINILLPKIKILDMGLIYSSRHGNIELVKMMLSLGANYYNGALINASLGGHNEIVDMMLSLGANNYDGALNHASYGGHIDIVRLMISLGADNYDMALVNACDGGHIDIVRLLLSLGARFDNSNVYYLNVYKLLKQNNQLCDNFKFNHKKNNVYNLLKFYKYKIPDINQLIYKFIIS